MAVDVAKQSHVSEVEQADLDALRSGIADVLLSECDRRAVHAFVDGQASSLERTLLQRAADLGWLAVALPDEYGGTGLGAAALVALHRELGKHLAPGPFIAVTAAAQTLTEIAKGPVLSEWLPRLAAGEAHIAVPAVLEGGVFESDLLLGSPDAEAALIPVDGGAWGLVRVTGRNASTLSTWDATRRVFRADLRGQPLLAEFPDGRGVRETLERYLALAIAADCMGGAQAVFEQTIEYMKTRKQFGRSIASFQALKHRAANLYASLSMHDQILTHAVDADVRRSFDAGYWTALAKAGASAAYVDIATECLQLHGGVGYTWEYDIHLFLKRAWLNEMLLKSNETVLDEAADRLRSAAQAGHSTLELSVR